LAVAVQLGQELGAYAGTAVEVVGVLGDEKLELAELLQLDEGEVGGVGHDPVARNAPLRCWQAGVTPRPYSVRAAEVGYARVGADAGTRKGDDVIGVDDPTRDLLDVFLATHGRRFPSREPKDGISSNLTLS
jgi:hypothetical protein